MVLVLLWVVAVIGWTRSPEPVQVVHEALDPMEAPRLFEAPVHQEVWMPPLEAEGEPPPPSSPSSDGFAPLLAELEELGLKIVPARLLQALDIRAVAPDGRISGEVQELFTLGEQETERLNQILTDTGSRLRELEMQEAEFTSLSESQFQIQIPPLESNISTELREGLRQGLRQELGDVDGSLLWDLMTGPHNARFWTDFGGEGVESLASS